MGSLSEHPGQYGFADAPPPKRKFIPRPRRPFDDYDEPASGRDPGPDPWWAFDWFYPALFISLVLWIGLGLIAMKWPPVGIALGIAGLIVIAFGRFYLFMIIREQDGLEQGLLVFLSRIHSYLYLYQNIEITLKPNILSGVGLLMVLTGMGLTLGGLRHR